jgi:FemAB-related protein (PEP-CTERM system-associated)
MSSKIRIEDSGSAGEVWDEYILSHPKGTFFHLIGWQRVLEKTFQYPSFSCVAKRNGRVCGVLPLFRVKLFPFGHSLISSPLAVYGGICADDPEAGLALLDHARGLADRMGVRYLEFRHLDTFGQMPTKDLYVTFRKEIYSDPEKNLASIPRKQRRMIRQGEKYGLTAQIGGEELLKDFYRIYSHSVRNLGTPVFPRRLFENLAAQFGSACRILGVFHEGRMVAGVLTFFFRQEVLPYYGGALKEAFRYAVNDFMYWNLMCYAAENGYKIYDFGRSKKGTGSYDFKRHWGFEPQPLAYQYHLVKQKNMPNMNPLNSWFSAPIWIWKRTPWKLTQWLGPKVVKFFP